MDESAKYFHPEVLSRIAGLDLRARHVVEGFVSGMHRSPYRGFSVEFACHRAYAPGDDIRHIDWRVYAKADRFFIKEYEEETNMRAHILLDCSGSMAYPDHAGTQRMRKWDYGATLATSLAYLLIRQQDAVGLTLFDDRIREQLPTSTNLASLQSMAATIGACRATGATGMNRPLAQLASQLPRRGMVMLVSDLLCDADDVLAGLQRLAHAGHDVLVFHILDEDELTFPFADRMLFEGMEGTGVEVRTDPQALRASYLAALDAHIGKLRAGCVDRRIDYTLISTADRLDYALAKYLASRRHHQHARA